MSNRFSKLQKRNAELESSIRSQLHFNHIMREERDAYARINKDLMFEISKLKVEIEVLKSENSTLKSDSQ